MCLTVFLRYTPVRSDSVVGELKLSEPTGLVLPGVYFGKEWVTSFCIYLVNCEHIFYCRC